MQLTQLQDEIIDTATPRAGSDPNVFARLLLHDLGDVHAAIRDLVVRGLLESADGDAYQLTAKGRAVHRAREKARNDAVKMNARTWQPC